MNKIVLISAFLCSTLLAETVPTEIQIVGEVIKETNGKRITGDEVSKVHNFKLSDGGWEISYRPESVGSFLGFSEWKRLYYKESKKSTSDNGKPKFIRVYRDLGKVLTHEEAQRFKNKALYVDIHSPKSGPYYEEPNPDYEEYKFSYKVFSGSYKNIDIELEIYDDGSALLFTDDGKFKILQELVKSSSYDSKDKRFMLGVYKNSK